MTEKKKLPMLIGAVVVSLVFVAGASDLGIGLKNWDSYTPVSRGDPVPDFATQLADGTPFSPAQLEGQVSLLTFWATWCRACGLEMPTVAAIERGYAKQPDFQVYGVNRDSGPPVQRRELVEAYLEDRQLGFTQIYDDGQLARAFGVEQIPYMVLVDKHGNARHMHLGQVSEQTLRSEIDALLDEQ